MLYREKEGWLGKDEVGRRRKWGLNEANMVSTALFYSVPPVTARYSTPRATGGVSTRSTACLRRERVERGDCDVRSTVALDVRGEFVDSLCGCVVRLECNDVSGSRHGGR